MTKAGEFAQELRAAAEKLLEDTAFATDGEVARATVFAVRQTMVRLAEYLDDESSKTKVFAEALAAGQEQALVMDAHVEALAGNGEKWMTPDEAAKVLLVSTQTVYKLIHTKQLGSRRVGRRLFVLRHDVETWGEEPQEEASE